MSSANSSVFLAAKLVAFTMCAPVVWIMLMLLAGAVGKIALVLGQWAGLLVLELVGVVPPSRLGLLSLVHVFTAFIAS